jgi:hypothetical protein
MPTIKRATSMTNNLHFARYCLYYSLILMAFGTVTAISMLLGTTMIASIGLSGHDQDIISLVIRYVVLFDLSVAFLYFGKTSSFSFAPSHVLLKLLLVSIAEIYKLIYSHGARQGSKTSFSQIHYRRFR